MFTGDRSIKSLCGHTFSCRSLSRRIPPNTDRFHPNNDRFHPNNDGFHHSNDRFHPKNDIMVFFFFFGDLTPDGSKSGKQLFYFEDDLCACAAPLAQLYDLTVSGRSVLSVEQLAVATRAAARESCCRAGEIHIQYGRNICSGFVWFHVIRC